MWNGWHKDCGSNNRYVSYMRSSRILMPILKRAERREDLMQTLVRDIAQALVDDTENVSVEVIRGNNTMVLELHVAKGDVGKIIGKQGRTADAIRTILSAISGKEKQRAILSIIEDPEKTFQRKLPKHQPPRKLVA
jgi:predicted RNA-binding protein YlqC (UPF0109 family)